MVAASELNNAKKQYSNKFRALAVSLIFLPGMVSANTNSFLVSETITTTTYDNYGNATNIEVQVNDPVKQETYATFTNNIYKPADVDAWILGRLERAEVTQYLPDNQDPIDGTCSDTDQYHLNTVARTCGTRVSSFEYRADGLLTKETIEPDNAALRLITEYEYDDFGNKDKVTVSGGDETAETDILARSTSTLYDARGQFPESTTNAKQHIESYEYDPRFGVMTKQTGPNLLDTVWEYDSFGRQKKEIRADGTTTEVIRQWCDGFNGETGDQTCPANGALSVKTLTTGAPETIVYSDAHGREIRVQTEGFSASGPGPHIYVDTVYDALGRVEKKSRPYFSGDTPLWHVFGYDELSRATSETSPDNSTSTTAYNGLETTVTNDLGQVNTRIKSVRGELIQVTDAIGEDTLYYYDPFGNLVSVKDAADNITNNNFDIRGRKVAMNDPDMGIWYYEYNAIGELTYQKDANTNTVTMIYDVLGRMTSRMESEGTTTWVYDTALGKGIGKLATVNSPISGDYKSESYEYDSLGRLKETITTINPLSSGASSYTLSQTYDPEGRISVITYPESYHHGNGFGLQVKNIYSPQGYLYQVTDNGDLTSTYNPSGNEVVFWQLNEMTAEGQLKKVNLGNGITTEKLYKEETGLLDRIRSSRALTGDVQNLTFTFDTLGNLKQRTDEERLTIEDFEYDDLNRMNKSIYNNSTTTTTTDYVYNKLGNLTAKTGIGDYNYEGVRPHAVTSIDTASETISLSYDDNGNVTGNYNFTAQQARTLAWTSFNKLSQVTQGATTVNFKYGANREMFKQVVTNGSGTSTRWYVNSLFEKDETAGHDTYIHYIKAGNETIGLYKSKTDNTQALQYFHKDHLGSITEITDDGGTVVESLAYDPHGKRRSVVNYADAIDSLGQIYSTKTLRCFTGHQYLDDVGLIHMGGRVYDPDLGRFMSPDPFVQEVANPQNLNRYSYVLNNPLSYTDPSGFFFKSLFKAIGKIFKGVVKAVKSVVKAIASEFKTIVAIGAAIAGNAICGPACGGFAAGMVSSGGDLKAGIIGALTATAFTGLHDFQPGCLACAKGLAKVAAHGVVGGISSELQGGDFFSGFISAGATQAFTLGGGFDALGISSSPEGFGDYAQNAAVAAVVGGGAAVLGGGKFRSGAVTGAFSRLFNDLGNEDCLFAPELCYPDEFTDRDLQLINSARSSAATLLVPASPAIAFFSRLFGFGRLTTSATVNVSDAVAAGLIKQNGTLYKVLSGIESRYASSSPKNIYDSSKIISDVTSGLGLDTGFVTSSTASQIVLKNAGGVITTISKSGGIVVTRGKDTLLRLIP